MAYGPNGNGRNGYGNGVSRRPSRRSTRADAWRDELSALQQRARARTKRKRQPTGNGMRAAAVTLTVLGLGFFSMVLLGILGSVQLAAMGYAAINRDLPSINQISSHET